MSFTNYLENKVLDHLFGAVIYTPSSTLYMALNTGVPIDDNGGSFGEPVGGAYARVAVVNNKTNFTTAAIGALENATVITFPQATATWGTVTHVGIFDAVVGGNLEASGLLALAKLITSGDTPSFASGDLNITLD